MAGSRENSPNNRVRSSSIRAARSDRGAEGADFAIQSKAAASAAPDIEDFDSQWLDFHSGDDGGASTSGVITTASAANHPRPSSLKMFFKANIAERACSIGEVPRR